MKFENVVDKFFLYAVFWPIVIALALLMFLLLLLIHPLIFLVAVALSIGLVWQTLAERP